MTNSKKTSYLKLSTLFVSCAAAGFAIPFGLLGLTVPKPAHAATYEVVPVNNGATLRGVIRFDGVKPAEERVLIGKDNEVCGDGEVVMNPVVTDSGNGLKDAVISIEGIKSGKAWAPPPELVQENCAFSPFVQVARKKADLKITNNDDLLHNVHSYEIIGKARRTLFNIAQPNAGQVDIKKLKARRGDVIQIACDAHNWMNSWVYTSDNPYHSISSMDGSFSIDGIPPGTYTLKVWHPEVGEISQEITVEAGSQSDLELTLTGKA